PQTVSPANRNTIGKDIRIEAQGVDQIIRDLVRLENELLRRRIIPKQNTNELSHQNFFGGDQLSLQEMHIALQVLQTFINFSKRKNLSPQDIQQSQIEVRGTFLGGLCFQRPICDDKILYRLPDGTCNNLIHTGQGKSVSTFSRLLPPDYADGINEPRRARDGSELPNARLVSLSIAQESQPQSSQYSLMLMQFGQFVDHDLSRTALTRTHDNNKISCCDENLIRDPRFLHPACFIIPVPSQDQFLLSKSQTCINFVRSAPAVNPKCRFGPREQLNQLSSYLDGNNIYGASETESKRLRLFQGGKLRFTMMNERPFLPLKESMNSSNFNCHVPKNTNMRCFETGDIRGNEVVDLIVLHTIWLREHNRIASILERMHPTWIDESLYQEAKRIVLAEFQHIIYNEFLPLILGGKTLDHFKLHLVPGFSEAYNPVVDTSILNEFTTAAYRLHSLIQGTLFLMSPDNKALGHLLLRDGFSNPAVLYQHGVYEMRIAGLTGQPIDRFDNFFSQDITNHLFQIPGKQFGLDLVALNIQRGRDHGIQGYVHYREVCGLSRIRSFEDLRSVLSNPAVADVLSKLYRRIEDVDLFIAGTSEKPLPGAIVGPTFACIIGEQFRRIKEGDRFWYENGNLDTSFRLNQLVEIKKTSLARILCDNSDIKMMQLFALLMPSASNPKVDCNRLPQVDLNQWLNY
ncbi:Peroxidase, partial [Sarcoptes scabiei]